MLRCFPASPKLSQFAVMIIAEPFVMHGVLGFASVTKGI